MVSAVPVLVRLFKSRNNTNPAKSGLLALQAMLLTALLLLTQAVLAQESSGDDSTVVYSAEYFAQWAPVTAQDMLARIPGQESSGPRGGGGGPPGGFSGNPSSGGRGLGSGGSGTEILVNGKRTAGKNQQASDVLSRIAADQVQEIRIIRGTSGELDVRGSSQVVNVLLFEELASSSLSYELSAGYVQDDSIQPGGSIAYSGQSAGLDYLFSFQRQARYRQSLSNESSVLGDFSPNDTVLEDRITDAPNNEFSMNLGYEFNPNSSIRLNGLYAINDGDTDVNRVTTNLRTSPASYLVEREATPQKQDNWEFGGDYELTVGNGDRFKFLAIANRNDRQNTRERFQVLPDNTEQKNLFLDTNSITEERIVRSSYTTDIFYGQDLEFGIERAQTILDSSLALGTLSSTGTPSAVVGGLVPVAVSNANSEVEELRYEPFMIHNWTINPQMSLESTLVYETSEITQSGDVNKSRDFDFIKPKVDFRYDVSQALQLRGTIERIVNQLSFSDFVASNDQQDEDANILAGNADLRQQTQWRYTFRSEYRFPNDAGVINAEFFYADHQDVIDRLDASPSEDNLFSVNGNIGDGTEYGTNINASIRMGFIGLPNVLFTPGLSLQDSKVTDPFLGNERRFQFFNRGQLRLTFRHDIPQWRVFWGMQYFDRIDGNMFRYDVDDIEFTVGEPFLGLFAQYVDRRGLTYRLDLRQLTDGSQCRERWRYVGRTSANILEELEYRCTHGGTDASFKVTGRF